MISKDKIYRTRDGREVQIYDIIEDCSYPVHGRMKDFDGEWVVNSWTKNGSASAYSGPTFSDLIEVRPRIKGWVNVYRALSGNTYSTFCQTKTEADNDHRASSCTSSMRVASIEIDIPEGEGL